jgi:uncharacterized protein (TIGR00369 family)
MFYNRLTKMYLSAPIQKLYPGITLKVKNNEAVITLPAGKEFHHAGGSLHGSVYFRLLDDACYFAAMSQVKDYFILTKNFKIDFKRPHIDGEIKAIGKMIKEENGEFYCEGELFNEGGKIIAIGSGNFVRNRKLPLEQVMD